MRKSSFSCGTVEFQVSPLRDLSDKMPTPKERQKMYDILLSLAKKDGYMVIHTKSLKNSDGDINKDCKIIRISKKLSLVRMLTVLAHELGHAEQIKMKKWDKFFDTDKFENDEKSKKYIEEAEINASERGQRILRDMGWENNFFEELHKENLNWLREEWYKHYLE